jgi:rfaE bifunctional protein nucleotidyltransferase chain/domain/rfaE bifunctional protein kinase chain/domain
VRRPLVVVGDLLLDRDLDGAVERVSPDAPVPVIRDPVERARPGGAGLAALLAARDGRSVTLVTAVGPGAAGERARAGLARAGVAVIDLGLDGPTPEKIRIKGAGHVIARVDRGDGGSGVGRAGPEARAAVAGAAAVLVSDYGRGVTDDPALRTALAGLPAEIPVVWDPHPRGAEPVDGVLVVTPNRAEAAGFAGAPDVHADRTAIVRRARALAERWRAVNVCVTLGADGALLVGGGGPPLAVPAARVERGDPCGAGDAFAVALAVALADGALPSEAVRRAAESAAAWVAGPHDPSVPEAGDPDEDAVAVAARVRGAGGVVVATGGCFDLLHAGHVRVLERARSLGDCLIVCLNSDESIRRLKGPERPVVGEADRAAILRALACVDAVAVFGDDTPEHVIAQLRPDVWAKGGDYRVADLPEAELVERWGGQAVVLPFVPGRSTSRIIEDVLQRGR